LSEAEPQTTKRRRGRPSPEESRALEETVLGTAMRLFCGLGYSATSVEAIAAAAGVGKKAIYARYPNKQALFSAVVAHAHAKQLWVVDELHAEDDALPLEAGLRHRAQAIIHSSATPEAVAFHQLLQREGQRFPELGQIFAAALSRTVEDLVRYFARQKAMGRIGAIDPRTAAVMFVFAIFGDLANRILFQTALPDAEEIDLYVGNISRLFAHGLGTGSAAEFATFVPSAFRASQELLSTD
jgi:AcrR family transcriptional regulator